MLTHSRIPDLVQRERFIRRLVVDGKVHIVAGDEGWATVPFRHEPTREVALFWTSRADAEQWSTVVAANPAVHQIGLGQLLGEVLPMLDGRRCLIGHDWSSDPADPVISPSELSERVWRERNDLLIAAMRTENRVWVLESASGPALLASARFVGSGMLPVWATREAAAHNIAGSWSTKRPLGVDLAKFREHYLPFVARHQMTIGPDPIPGAGARELCHHEFTTLAYPADALSKLRAIG